MSITGGKPNERTGFPSVIMPNFGGGTIFMPLMNMMGFEEGLCALLFLEKKLSMVN